MCEIAVAFPFVIGQSVSQGVAVQGEDTKNYALQALTEALDRAEAMVSGGRSGRVEAPVSFGCCEVVNSWKHFFNVFALSFCQSHFAQVEMLSGHQRHSDVSEAMQCGFET